MYTIGRTESGSQLFKVTIRHITSVLKKKKSPISGVGDGLRMQIRTRHIVDGHKNAEYFQKDLKNHLMLLITSLFLEEY